MPGTTTVQLAIWIDAELGTRFRNHCVRHGILFRAAAAEAIAAYLDLPRAGASEPAGELSLHLSASGLGTSEFDSHNGGHEK